MKKIRALSHSGGVFTALSDFVLDNGGVVYGCALNDKFLAEHRRAAKKEERDAFRGSKYIQSEINNCYSLCADDLLEFVYLKYRSVKFNEKYDIDKKLILTLLT